MAWNIGSIIRAVVGTSDGTTTGTPSVLKIVAGVASVISTTADALLTTINASVGVMDDWDAVHDSPAGTDGVRQALTAYADPSVLPADVSANGDNVRAAGSRKGEQFVYKSRLDYQEDSARNVARVEQQPTPSAEVAADAVIVAAGTAGRIYALLSSVTVAAQVLLRQDGVVGGAIIKTFDLPIGFHSIDLHGLPYGNGLYFDHVAGTHTSVVLFRNDT